MCIRVILRQTKWDYIPAIYLFWYFPTIIFAGKKTQAKLVENVNRTAKNISKCTKENIKTLQKHKVRIDTLVLIALSNSSLDKIDDFESEPGYATMLNNDTKIVNWLFYEKYKCRKMLWFILVGNTFVFVSFSDVVCVYYFMKLLQLWECLFHYPF